MKRMVVLFLLLASATLAANAAYIIQLRDGKIITADDKVFVKNDMAYFTRRGVFFYLPASQVDLEASEKANMVAAAPSTGLIIESSEAAPAAVTPAAKSAVIGDEQLDLIRKRSRLANEGQFKPAAADAQSPSAPAAPAAKPANAASNRAEIQDRMNGLLQQQSSLQQDQTNLQNQLSTLKESYNSSTQQSDKEQLDAQIQSLSSQLADVQNNMSSVQGYIVATQQQLSSTPVVVDTSRE